MSISKKSFFSVFVFCAVVAFITLTFSSCKKEFNFKASATNHTAVFNELWKVIDERYALFAVKNVQWNDIYEYYKQLVNDESTDKEFFKLLSGMLDSLRDGHVTLRNQTDTFFYDGFYKPYLHNFSYAVLINNYLHSEFSKSGEIIYKIAGDIGYIYIGSFSKNISDAEIDKVINEMQACKGLILDVRDNLGGNAVLANRLFARFISEKKLVKYEKIKSNIGHEDFYSPQPYYVSPSAVKFLKPVVVLTNRSCFSACNDFVMYMSQLEQVKIFGDQTGGGGSVPYSYLLSNGWQLNYSATVTLSPQLLTIEDGIEPDELITMTPIQESSGFDPLIERAYQYLQ